MGKGETHHFRDYNPDAPLCVRFFMSGSIGRRCYLWNRTNIIRQFYNITHRTHMWIWCDTHMIYTYIYIYRWTRQKPMEEGVTTLGRLTSIIIYYCVIIILGAYIMCFRSLHVIISKYMNPVVRTSSQCTLYYYYCDWKTRYYVLLLCCIRFHARAPR